MEQQNQQPIQKETNTPKNLQPLKKTFVSNKWLFLVVAGFSISLMLLIGVYALIQSLQQFKVLSIAPGDQFCESDLDCATILTDCSACKCGTPINKIHVQKYVEQRESLCADYDGIACLPCAPRPLQCINNRCTILEKSPQRDIEEDTLEGWQTYRNDEFGFEVKYPDAYGDIFEAPNFTREMALRVNIKGRSYASELSAQKSFVFTQQEGLRAHIFNLDSYTLANPDELDEFSYDSSTKRWKAAYVGITKQPNPKIVEQNQWTGYEFTFGDADERTSFVVIPFSERGIMMEVQFDADDSSPDEKEAFLSSIKFFEAELFTAEQVLKQQESFDGKSIRVKGKVSSEVFVDQFGLGGSRLLMKTDGGEIHLSTWSGTLADAARENKEVVLYGKYRAEDSFLVTPYGCQGCIELMP